MDWKFTLCEPDIGEDEIRAVTDVLRSRWLTMGAVTEQFEKEFAEKVGVKYALAVTNATAALHLAHLALGIKPGDEVICPALTFVATANASRYAGATVVFADSVSETDLTVDPAEIEKMITPRTKAVSVVHYGGFSANMDAIMAIAEKRKLAVIEDCAHSPLAKMKFQGRTDVALGTIGAVGCFSFFW